MNLHPSLFQRFLLMLLPAIFCTWTSLRTVISFDHRFPMILPRSTFPSKEEFITITRQPSPTEENFLDCFEWNTDRWLNGPRLGNANESYGIDYQLARQMILARDGPGILSRTICHEDSRLRNTEGDQSVRRWTVRLLYLLTHYNQHHQAYQEANRAQHPICQAQRAERGIGPFDYECKLAKFLVVRLDHNGIGANVRMAMIPALMVGLVLQRIVLFINNAPTGPPFVRQPWTLASCPRRDAQCIFFPASPCTITQQALANAYTLSRSERRRLFRSGMLPSGRDNETVLALHFPFRPQREPDQLRSILFQQMQNWIDYTAKNDTRDPILLSTDAAHRDILEQAASDILDPGEAMLNTYSYYGAGSSLYHGLLLYAMRPNPLATKKIQEFVHESIPDNFNPNRAVGIPIRASDKCGTESECMAFAQYVNAAQESWVEIMALNPIEDTAAIDYVITTESRTIQRELEEYHALPAGSRFVLNRRDVIPDTGFFAEPAVNSTSTPADDIILSAMTSLKLQLMTRLTIGNCCSNFHVLMKDLLDEGCGMLSDAKFQCLQDHSNENFRLCCSWDKSPECLSKQNGHIAYLNMTYAPLRISLTHTQ